jgi:hypothetical protein
MKNRYHAVVQFDTGYYCVGTYDAYGIKLIKDARWLSKDDAINFLIGSNF